MSIFGKRSGSATANPGDPVVEPKSRFGKMFKRALEEGKFQELYAPMITGERKRPDIPDVNKDGVGDSSDLEVLSGSLNKLGARRFSKGGEVKGYNCGGMVHGKKYNTGGIAENSCRGGGKALRGTKFRGVK